MQSREEGSKGRSSVVEVDKVCRVILTVRKEREREREREIVSEEALGRPLEEDLGHFQDSLPQRKPALIWNGIVYLWWCLKFEFESSSPERGIPCVRGLSNLFRRKDSQNPLGMLYTY